MGFFDVSPPPDEDVDDLDELEEQTEGRWLPGVLPVGQFIGRSERAAVAVRELVGLPGGFEVKIVAWLRKPPRHGARFGPFHREIVLAAHGPWDLRDENGQLADELVRFGVQFPDGSRVTNIDYEQGWPDATEPMHGMSTHGGSSSSGEADQEFWIWPVPVAGDVTLVCEWPAYGIAESRLTIDGDELRTAAARAQPVWPDEPSPDRAGTGHRGYSAAWRHARMRAGPMVSEAVGEPGDLSGPDPDEAGTGPGSSGPGAAT
jgi:hypothetical protein